MWHCVAQFYTMFAPDAFLAPTVLQVADTNGGGKGEEVRCPLSAAPFLVRWRHLEILFSVLPRRLNLTRGFKSAVS